MRSVEYPATATTLRTFGCDGAGNVTADDRAGTVCGYGHDARGRLAQVSVGGQVVADYVYDGLERLALRTTQNMTPSGTTHYVHDLAGHPIAEASASGGTVREYVWLDDMPLAVVADVDTASPQTWFVHADHLDRPIRMTDAARAIVWDAVYKPFGEVHAVTGASVNLRPAASSSAPSWRQARSCRLVGNVMSDAPPDTRSARHLDIFSIFDCISYLRRPAATCPRRAAAFEARPLLHGRQRP